MCRGRRSAGDCGQKETAISTLDSPNQAPPPSGLHARVEGLVMGPMTPRQRHNARVVIAGDGLWGFQSALIAGSTVLTLLLSGLGAGKGTIGIVRAVEVGGLVLPQILGAYFFRPRRNRKLKLILWHLFLVVPFLWINAALAHFAGDLPRALVPVGLLVFYALSVLGVGVTIPPWIDWMADVFGPQLRGRVVGMCLSAAAGMGVFGSLLAGRLIEHDPRPEGFAWHFALAGAVATASLLTFLLVRGGEADDRGSQPIGDKRELTRHFLQSLQDANFRTFLIGGMLATLGFSILPFIAVHFTSAAGGSLSGPFVVSSAAAQALATSLSYYVFGRLGDKRGHRLGMMACCIMQMAALAVMLLAQGPASCILAYGLVGLAMGAGGIAQYNLLLETCPHEGRVAHITAGNLMIALASITGPLLSGLAAQRWGTPRLFAICLALSATALIWFAFRLREPRQSVER